MQGLPPRKTPVKMVDDVDDARPTYHLQDILSTLQSHADRHRFFCLDKILRIVRYRLEAFR
jgi:hypothetical protein